MGSITNQEKKDLERYVRYLCLKSTQVIVQGRLGKLITTESVSTPCGAEWFNVAIKDYPEIQKEAKAALRNGIPRQDKALVTEISLRTSDADSLVLEVWSIGISNNCSASRVRLTIYNRMSMLLKSLLCLSRVTPAYRLSRNQGSEYVLCYRVYMDKVCLDGLGEGFKTLHVGSVTSPIGNITMSVAYRSVENLHVSTREMSSQAPMGFPMKTDHFAFKQYSSTPAHPCHTLTSRFRTTSEASDASSSYATSPSSPIFNVVDSSYSASTSMAKDKDRNGAMFIVGTPPSFNTSLEPSSFKVRHRHSCTPALGPHVNSIEKYRNTSNPIKMPGSREQTTASKTLRYGFSAPAIDTRYLSSPSACPVSTTAQDKYENCDPNNAPANDTTDSAAPFATTYCHWSNDNVTKVKAGNVASPSTAAGQVVRASHGNSQIPLNWNQSAACSSKSYTESPLSFQAGAFVSGSKTAARAQKTMAEADAAVPPFSALINSPSLDDVSDDSSSRKSDPDTTLDRNDKGTLENSKTANGLSGSKTSLSSDKSMDSSSTERGSKHASDDFVMVELNPAFGRGDSMGDLGTFYRECENVPELVMFEEQKGVETEETLLGLTKQLEDYEQDLSEFDAFVMEMQATT